jgi:ferric iron reductase protein FhuF
VHVTTAAAAAEALLAGPVRRLAAPLTVTTAAAASMSDRVLWGNVWSALAGAAAAAAVHDAAAGTTAAAIVRGVLAADGRPLTGRYLTRTRYERETCCLYYRLPGGGLCGDCVLHRVLAERR